MVYDCVYSMNWLINDNYLFGVREGFNINNNDCLYLFDLDYTLIRTASNRKFAVGKDDWVILHPNIGPRLAGKQVGIVSNQRGLKDKAIEDWMEKINNISKEIHIDFVFCSLKYDLMSKPSPKSYNTIKRLLKIKIKRANITYIGDACGRKGDFSDTDCKYALNNNFLFKTPQQFFIEDKPENIDITYLDIQYYDDDEYDCILRKIMKRLKKDKVLIMMVGYPASGKSYTRNCIMLNDDRVCYFNNDDISRKVKNEKLFKARYITNKDYVIIDNTNMALKTRSEMLNKFEDHYKLCIHFDYDFDLCCNHLNYLRAYNDGHDVIHKIVYNNMRKGYVEPGEEFDEIIKITKLPKELKTDMYFF